MAGIGAWPLLTLMPEMLTSTPELTAKMRKGSELLRRTVNSDAPGPLIEMFVERSGSAESRFIVPVTWKPIASPEGSALACWTAARNVHAPFESAQTPSELFASGVSPRLLTVKLDADA